MAIYFYPNERETHGCQPFSPPANVHPRCPYDDTELTWIMSLPLTKEANSEYVHHYGCETCGYRDTLPNDATRLLTPLEQLFPLPGDMGPYASKDTWG